MGVFLNENAAARSSRDTRHQENALETSTPRPASNTLEEVIHHGYGRKIDQ